MPAAPSVGVLAQLGMDPAGNATEAYEFVSESLTSDRTIINTAGIRGSRSRVIERLRQGTLAPGGQIVMDPSPHELRKLLPRILGGSESAGAGFFTYALTESLTTNGTFVTQIDRVAKVFKYTGCQVDKATFSSSVGQVLRMTLDIEALSETIGNAGTFPALTIDNTAPFVFFDGTLTLGGTTYQMHDVQLTIDNMLKKDRFVNNQTRTDLPALDRVVTLRCTVPYTADTVGLYDGGQAGITSDLKFAYGGAGDGAAGRSLHFLLQNVVFPARKSPSVPNKDEILLLLEGEVYNTGGTAELSVKLDEVL